MRKWLLVLGLCVGVGLAPLVWLGAEDARRAALFDARVREADRRVRVASDRVDELCQGELWLRLQEPWVDELHQARVEHREALEQRRALQEEQARRQPSWPARMRGEVRRRTGW